MLNLLQSQLAFFGAIDEAVLYAKEGHGAKPDEVLRTVGTLLPGTTGFGQAGWYHELHDFANRPGVRNRGWRGPVAFPSVEQSLEYLQAETAEERMRLATDALRAEPTPEPTPQPRTEPPSEPTPKGTTEPPPEPPRTPAALPERVAGSQYTSYHDPVLARSAYAAMVLARIDDLGGMPPRLTVIPDLPAQIMGGGGQLLGRHPRPIQPRQPDVGTDRARAARRGEASRVTATVAQLRGEEDQSTIRRSVPAVLRHTRVVRRAVLQHALHQHDR